MKKQTDLASQLGEQTLIRKRIHRGIFAFPAIFAGLMLLVDLPVFLFLRSVFHMFDQFQQPDSSITIHLLWLLLGAVSLLPALVVFALVLLAHLNSEIVLTTKRLVYRTGLLSRASGELPLENVDAIFIVEPLLGRIFGYGTIAVTSVGGTQFPLRYIGEPQVFHATLQRWVNESKSNTLTQRQAVGAR
jgi:uncharacterized membrane protein YdbT with pleckstrin-like domain